MITVSVNASGLESKLRRIGQMTGEDSGKLIKQESRLLSVGLAKVTQPFDFGGDAKKKGEGSLIRDYSKVYPDVDSEFIANQIRAKARPNNKEAAKQRWLKYARGGRADAMDAMLQDMKLGDNIHGVKADPAYHKNRWNRGTLKKGVSQIVTNRRSVEALKKQALKMVGFAKGGWAACAQKLGGTRGIVGAWITRHKNRSPGRVIDKSRNTLKPSVTIINGIDYTSQVLSQSGKAKAISDREIKLTERINGMVKSGKYR